MTMTAVHRRRTIQGKAGNAALFRDKPSGNQAGPLTSPRTATPGPGTAELTQGANAMSIVPGGLQIVDDAADVMYWLEPGFTREAGRALLIESMALSVVTIYAGWRTAKSAGSTFSPGLNYLGGAYGWRAHGKWWPQDYVTLSPMPPGVRNQALLILRAAGGFALQRIGRAGKWRLMMVEAESSGSPIFAGIASLAASTGDSRYSQISVPAGKWTPRPLASDSFDRANGAVGLTDGLGAAEGGGAGLAWYFPANTTATIDNNTLKMTGTGDGTIVGLVDAGQADVLVEGHYPLDTSEDGLIVRATDELNYWRGVATTTYLVIYEINNNVFTNRANQSGLTLSAAPGKVTMVADGRGIAVYAIDASGHQRIAYNVATFNQAATKVGFRGDSGLQRFAAYARFQDVPIVPDADAPGYLIRDDFLHYVPVSEVNGTAADPGPGTRTVTDTTNKLKSYGGLLQIADGHPADYTDPRIVYDAVTREAGRCLHVRSIAQAAIACRIGWASSPTPTTSHLRHAIGIFSTAVNAYYGNLVSQVSANDLNRPVEVILAMRATGSFIVVNQDDKGWKLGMVTRLGNSSPMYPAIKHYSGPIDHEFVRVPAQQWLPPALAADTFNRADSDDLGETDGGPDAAGTGAGVPWEVLREDVDGNVAIENNALKCVNDSVVAVDVGTPDAVAYVEFTPSGVTGGIAARCVDASNYWRFGVNNSGSGYLIEIVNDVLTTRASASALTVGADQFILTCDGDTLEGYHLGSAAHTRMAYTSTVHNAATKFGIRGVSPAENFAVYARNQEPPF